MAKKENNRRRFPGESSKHRPDRAAKRREEAMARQAKTDSLTAQQRLALLDIKFGPNQGAEEERTRLLKAVKENKKQPITLNSSMEILNVQVLPDEIMAEIEAMNDELNNKKKLKAKDRRARDQKLNK